MMDIDTYSVIYGYEDLFRKAVIAGKPESQQALRQQLFDYIKNADFKGEQSETLLRRTDIKLQIIEDEYNINSSPYLCDWQKQHWLLDISDAYTELANTYFQSSLSKVDRETRRAVDY